MTDQNPSAAVAIIRRTSDQGKVYYLVLRRVAHPDDPWSGHFSFPGGRKENGDKDLLSTCLRETQEETGILLSKRQLELRLPLEPAGRNFNAPLWVQPFLFKIIKKPELTLEPSEIQSFIWLDASQFRDRRNHQQVEMLPGKIFPAFPIEDYYLWGFTYRLLQSIVSQSEK